MSTAELLRCLATLTEAGVPIDGSLDVLSAGRPDWASVLRPVCAQVRQGCPLSEGLELFPKVFSPFHVGLVRVGEGSGTLHRILGRLADFEEHARHLGFRLKGALVYP